MPDHIAGRLLLQDRALHTFTFPERMFLVVACATFSCNDDTSVTKTNVPIVSCQAFPNTKNHCSRYSHEVRMPGLEFLVNGH